MNTMNTQRGVSFIPGRSAPRDIGMERVEAAVRRQQGEAAPKAKAPFDKKAWHARKAAEACKAEQIESCYRKHVPAQVRAIEAGVEVLSKREESIERMMRDNRAVGI